MFQEGGVGSVLDGVPLKAPVLEKNEDVTMETKDDMQHTCAHTPFRAKKHARRKATPQDS